MGAEDLYESRASGATDELRSYLHGSSHNMADEAEKKKVFKSKKIEFTQKLVCAESRHSKKFRSSMMG